MPQAFLTHDLFPVVVEYRRGEFKSKTPQTRGSRFGTPGAIRTHDLLYRKQTLYPAELRVLNRG